MVLIDWKNRRDRVFYVYREEPTERGLRFVVKGHSETYEEALSLATDLVTET